MYLTVVSMVVLSFLMKHIADYHQGHIFGAVTLIWI